MVALFGGHRESNETFLQCVVREIHEEISYFVPPERFEHLASYRGVDVDITAEGGTVHGEFFVVRDVPANAILVTEGALLVVRRNDLLSLMRQLVPSAQYAMKVFFKNQSYP